MSYVHDRKNFDYEWYQCTCCPYGYHIDLDFVRYCESIGQSERTASINKRKDRRRQRQSMDVLLGLIPSSTTLTTTITTTTPFQEQTIQEKMTPSPSASFTLSDAVVDFERTLQRSTKTTLSNNLPDVTAVSTIRQTPSPSSISTASDGVPQKDYDSISLESNGLSPAALQTIREQMALSLKRTKQLEEQVRNIPELKAEIDRLKSEKLDLIQQLLQRPREENNHSNNYNLNHINNNNLDAPRKDFGVNCVVLTRSVGVGHQTPNTKSISTGTLSFENSQTRSTQTPRSDVIKVAKGVQVQSYVHNLNDASSQTIEFAKFTASKASMALPDTTPKAIQTSVEVTSVGVSDDTVSEIVRKSSIGVGTEEIKEKESISLAGLSIVKDVQEREIENVIRNSVGSQYEPDVRNKSTQHEANVVSKGCQNVVKQSHKSTQGEIVTNSTKNTDTIGLIKTADFSSAFKGKQSEIGVNTDKIQASEAKCPNCSGKEVVESRKDEPVPPSRIPRPSEKKRSFERQITYTKIPSPVVTPTNYSPRLSGLDLSGKSDDGSNLERVRTRFEGNFQLEEEEKTQHKYETPYVERKKAVPTKEMQAAMKVLNDSLQKGHAKNIENQVKNAVHIILQEWFKVSSLVTADPHDVEDYLDCFEEVSSVLLEYIVNMVDASGNTAMHYAVSHGNFDVVSILLDSKVCDINKQNKAGYTSVMLVSLAEVRSQAHANVVKRLFSLADVNIRAKQHGQTALMLAVSHGRLDMVTMLLEAGADINIQDEDGSTALMCAAEHGHIDIVKYFLSQPDCDSSISDMDGSTALKIAMEAGHRHIGVLLYAHERNLSAGPAKTKKSKSASASPKASSSPLVSKKSFKAITSNK